MSLVPVPKANPSAPYSTSQRVAVPFSTQVKLAVVAVTPDDAKPPGDAHAGGANSSAPISTVV